MDQSLILGLGRRTFPSLTLGGYDYNRFVPNNVKFKYNGDLESPYLVDISYIHLNGTVNGTVREVDIYPSKMESKDSAFPGPTTASIDSNLPYMHLPQAVCNEIAWAYKLSYNESMNRYIIPDDVDQALSKNGATLTISLTSLTDTTQTVNITIPYPSLNLYNGYPFGNGQRYFPMRPAVYPGKYSLGRAFLQEAYMIADHDRNEFSISQVNWDADLSKTNMIAQSLPGTQTKSALGAIIGGVVGGVILLLALLYFCCRKASVNVKIKFGKGKDEATDTRSTDPNDTESTPTSPDEEVKPIEVPANAIHEVDGTGLSPPVEMDGKTFTELPDQSGTLAGYFKEVELDASNEKRVFEMEGSPVNIDLLKKSQPPLSDATSGNTGSDTTANTSRTTNTPLSIPSRSQGLYSSNESTMASGVSSLSSGRDTVPPLPQIPIESRSSRGIRDRLNGVEVPPASPIPQTPLEFYGNRIPESRWKEAKIKAIQQKLGNRNQLAVPTTDIAGDRESPSALPAPPPDYVEKDRSLFQQQNSRSVPQIQTNFEKEEKRKMPRQATKQDFSHLGVLPEPSSPIAASPIPKTPREYYRQPVTISGVLSKQSGTPRAQPEVNIPSFAVTPASPSGTFNEDATEGGVRNERHGNPAEESPDEENVKGKGRVRRQ
jgi:hypothetical protein